MATEQHRLKRAPACCRVEPIIMSAGELEHEWAGTPGKLIRERYRWGALAGWGGRAGWAGRAARELHWWGWAGGCNLLGGGRCFKPVRARAGQCAVCTQHAPLSVRCRRAAEVSRVHGKLSCLVINDIDAGGCGGWAGGWVVCGQARERAGAWHPCAWGWQIGRCRCAPHWGDAPA